MAGLTRKFLFLNGLAPDGGVNHPQTWKIENFCLKSIPYEKLIDIRAQFSLLTYPTWILIFYAQKRVKLGQSSGGTWPLPSGQHQI